MARSLAPLAAAIFLAGLTLVAPQVFNDGDTYWHIATGQWILDHGRVPAFDVFSYSQPGVPWVAQEWLSEVLMAIAWRGGGWSGVASLFALAMAFAGWLMVRRLSQAISGVALLLTATLAFSCMAGSLLARPQLLTLPILIVWSSQLLAARAERRAPGLAWALVITLWANLHASYVIGFLLAGAFGVEALVEAEGARWPVVRTWGLFGLACLAASLLTPHGFAGLVYPFSVMTMSILPNIVEWRPADFSQMSPFETALLVTLFVCFTQSVRVPPVRALLLLALLYMSLHHARHQLILAAVAPLILAEPLAQAVGRSPVPLRLQPRLLAAGVGALALLIGARLFFPIVRGDDAASPATAMAQLPVELRGQPVLNGYGLGGYLIFNDVKPFIDGRADMYGDRFSTEYFRATSPDGKALAHILDQYRVAWTIFSPSDPTATALDANGGWRRLYSDRYAVIHVRAVPLPAPG